MNMTPCRSRRRRDYDDLESGSRWDIARWSGEEWTEVDRCFCGFVLMFALFCVTMFILISVLEWCCSEK